MASRSRLKYSGETKGSTGIGPVPMPPAAAVQLDRPACVSLSFAVVPMRAPGLRTDERPRRKAFGDARLFKQFDRIGYFRQ